jgi:PhnB protein
MAAFNFYLNFPGNAEEAFNFYKSVLGGEFAAVMRFNDYPGGGENDQNQIPPALMDKIMHIALPIGNGNMLMGTDAAEGMGPKFVAGNNVHICVNPISEEEARRLFNGLSAGGEVSVPLNQAFWGGLFGTFTDKFSINWMFNFDPRQN